MVVYLKKENGGLKRLNSPEKGCWIHLYGPFGTEETQKLSEQLSIDIDFITDSLDIDERSRYESEEGVDLIVLKTPLPNDGISDIEASYITIPIGIIRTADNLITVSAYKNDVIEFFLNTPPKNFNPDDVEGTILSIFERNVTMFQQFLKNINNERYAYEKALYKSSSNDDLTNLRFNDLLLLKIQRSNFLKIKDEDKLDLLADIIIENQQALSMSEMYSDILNGTMDAFASIISNNLNEIMKRLTSVTILLTVPMLIASLFGMNVKLPGEEHPYAFVFVFGICILISGLMGGYFVKKKWF